ncbi:ATP synthase subunit D domain-containing protein [Rutstroemia sp. NJR-2017a WRK4]|nr:ATP synthase subunit D domain-containing protein [Rutstroemia sp. NJR-2017a WRK4]
MSIPASTVEALTKEIDGFLERYLHLLDQYATLRAELSSLSSSMHINLSRANFTSQNNIRYDTSGFDDRMQALRSCDVTIPENASNTQPAPPTFAIKETSLLDRPDEGSEDTKTVPIKKDPLKMFGLFIPQALRLTQVDSIKIVENIIPRLVNTEKEMADLEIRIRRARKYRRKIETAEVKKSSSIESSRAPEPNVA